MSGKHGERLNSGNVPGLVVGDCRGDNSTDAYSPNEHKRTITFTEQGDLTQQTSSNYLSEELIKACGFRRISNKLILFLTIDPVNTLSKYLAPTKRTFNQFHLGTPVLYSPRNINTFNAIQQKSIPPPRRLRIILIEMY